jgi:hypothetical protein
VGRTLTLVVAGALLAGCGGPTLPSSPTTSPPPLIASPASPAASTNGVLATPTALATESLAPAWSPAPTDPFPGGLLIADRGNDRLIVVDNAGRIVWNFPVTGSLPAGQAFSADDAFISLDGRGRSRRTTKISRSSTASTSRPAE